MNMNKYIFISELLENNKLNQDQKNRILELASQELAIDSKIEDRIQTIEQVIFKSQQAQGDDSKDRTPASDQDINRKKYFDPYYLYNFLFDYNQDVMLKTTCHDSDEDMTININEYCNSKVYNFSEHLKRIKERFSDLENKHKYAPRSVKALIRGYLTGKDYQGNELENGWSTAGIKMNWSSSDLYDWSEKNTNYPPNLNQDFASSKEIDILPINPQIDSPISYESIQNFTQLVLHFKNLFHLKSGEQSWRSIIDRFNRSEKLTEKIDFNISPDLFQENLEHFTDVDKLLQAYKKIIKLIIKQHKGSDHPKVELRFYEKESIIIFSIHHINTTYNKSLSSTLSRPKGDMYNDLIDKQINQLCNLYLRADFGSGEYALINLWDGNELSHIELNEFKGVEHQLAFPKNKKR